MITVHFVFLQRSLALRTWRQLPSMPGKKMCCCVVAVGDYIVVIGGFSGESTACDDVYAFHTTTHRWDMWLSTPYALCAAASNGDDLYVFGGCPLLGGQAVREVFKLSANRQEWKPLPKMVHRACDAAATFYKGRLYVLGGENSWRMEVIGKVACDRVKPMPSGPLAHHLQIFDLEQRKWRLGSPMLSPDPYMNNDCLLPFGEHLICDRFQCYNVDEDTWMELPERRSGLTTAMAVVDHCVLFVGGGYPGNEKVDMLKVRHDQWQYESLTETRSSRRGAGAAELNGIIYVAGGQSAFGDVLNEFDFFM